MNTGRIDFIIQELSVHKTASIARLAEKCGVSTYTIRRDVQILEKQGMVYRTYGWVTLAKEFLTQQTYDVRKNSRVAEKQAIGEMAADLVQDNDTLFLAPSSTVSYMLPFLRRKKGLTVITNGAQMVLECISTLKDANIIAIGGVVNGKLLGTVGSAALAQMQHLCANICFFSPKALTMENGALCWDEEIAAILREAIKISRQVVMVCTSNKFDTFNSHVICPLSRLDYVITETAPSRAWSDAFEKADVELIYPER